MGQQLFPPTILTTREAGALAEARLRSRGFGGDTRVGCRHGWLALSSCSLHLALSPWAARTQAFPCFSQCLTWHSLRANGLVKMQCSKGYGSGT